MNDARLLARAIVHLLPRISRLMRREAALASGGNLSLPQFRILQYIHDGCRSISRLAALHGVSQPAMSALVERMSRDGYVTRARDRDDRRRQALALSPKGLALMKRTSGKIEARIAKVIAQLDPGTRRQLGPQLHALHDAFATERVDTAEGEKTAGPRAPRRTSIKTSKGGA